MEQFVLVPLSVYNSNSNSTFVTKQKVPIYKPEQTPTYHKGTLKQEINQELTISASPLVNKISESPRINLSNFHTLILDWNRDWCAVEVLCTTFEAQKHTHTRYLLYFT